MKIEKLKKIMLKLMCKNIFYLSFFLFLCFVKSNAQNYLIDKKKLNDSVILDQQIIILTESLLKDFQSSNKLDSIEKRIYFNLVLDNYSYIEKDIKLYRRTLSKEEWEKQLFFLVEIYSNIKLSSIKKNNTFNHISKKIISKSFANLSDNDFIKLDKLLIKPEKIKIQFNDFISNINSDTLSYNQAFNLIKIYQNYKINLLIGNEILNKYKILNKAKFKIETRDVKLNNDIILTATIITKKKSKSKLPVILTNNIYAGYNDTLVAKRAAINNYIGVVFNPRGKRNNLDENNPFENEAEDLFEIIDWISKQKWCNGKIGMLGGSYSGFSQWATTKKMHPALKTIVPQVAVGIGAIDFPMCNNVFMSYSLQWINYVTNNNLTDRSDFFDFNKWNNVNEKWFQSGKKFRDLDSISGKKSIIFQKWLDHPSYDNYWKSMIPFKEDYSKINIPILTITGYYDIDQKGALYYLREHFKYHRNPNHYLVIGPFNHSTAQTQTQNTLYGYTLDSVARISMLDISYEWFDHILKNKSKPKLLKDKINFQIMDTNKWKHVESIDKTSNNSIKFYLKNNINNESVFTKPNTIESNNQIIDFKNRESNNDYYHYSEKDSTYISKNTLVFISEELEKDVIISGSFEGEIKVIINKKDFDFNLNMMQIEPTGDLFNLSSFKGRASYLHNSYERKLLTPNEKQILPISTYNTDFISKKIIKGSKIILFVSVNFNKEDQINYGTGKDVSDESILDANEPLEIQWFNDSYIKIPTID
ncbi:CocE/NonD family hydrolase [Flavobacterium sp.]|uniref:CocE/NonD family hydrolase n=1 Tax=Flavobacterium sp. TaxID=239 RepID=UPI003F6A4F28